MSKNCIPMYTVNFADNPMQSLLKSQLICFLKVNRINGINDLIDLIANDTKSINTDKGKAKFSLEDNIQEFVVRKILEASSAELSFVEPSTPGEDYDYKESTNAITVCNYIDQQTGVPGIPKIKMAIDIDDYAQQVKNYLEDPSKPVSPELQEVINFIKESIRNDPNNQDAYNEAINKELQNWISIKKDGFALHHIIAAVWSNAKGGNLLENFTTFNKFIEEKYPDFYSKINETGPDGTSYAFKLYNTLLESRKSVNSVLVTGERESYKNSIIFNKHFKARTQDGKIIGCHIDQMYVDKNGKIYLFNFKTTSTNSNKWSVNKDMKYSYEMAVIKKILAANGLKVEYTDENGYKHDNIEMYNVPIVFSYNSDCSKIVNVTQDQSGNDAHCISYITRNNRAFLRDFEETVKDWVVDNPLQDSDMFNMIADPDIAEPNRFLRSINPIYDAKALGLKQAAISWIKQSIRNGNIKWDESNAYWIVKMGDKIETVSDPTRADNNAQILKLVQANYQSLDSGEAIVIEALVEEIEKNYAMKGTGFMNNRGFKFNSQYAQITFAKYFEVDDYGNHMWQFIKNPTLERCGILLFYNHITKQVDTIIPSSFQVQEQIPTKCGDDNLLGYYESSVNSPVKLKSTYGNMEIFRGLALINQVIDKLPEGAKLGNISVITPYSGGKGIVRTFEEMVPEFNKAVAYLNKNSDEKFKNNFRRENIMQAQEVIYSIYAQVKDSAVLSAASKSTILGNLRLDDISSIKTKEAKLKKYQEIIEAIENIFNTSDFATIYRKYVAGSTQHKMLASIYIDCIKAINAFNGMYSPEVYKINSMQSYLLPQYANADSQVRFISNLYNKALDTIATKFQAAYTPIRSKILDFYEANNYNTAKSFIKGSAESLYKNMFEVVDGKKTWQFVNPYDKSIPLSDSERSLLKELLFNIHKTKASSIINYPFHFSGVSDPALLDKLENDISFRMQYLQVPLERGSNSHQNRRSLEDKIKHNKQELQKAKQRGFMQYLKDKFNENTNGIGYADGTTYEANLNNLSIPNPILKSIVSGEVRAQILAQYDDSYFETNVEYLMADLVERTIAQEELAKVVFSGKALIFQMQLAGESQGETAKAVLQKSQKEVEDYLKLNVFGKSLMEDTSQAVSTIVDPMKTLASHLFITLNLRSAFRDSFEGLWQNMARTISHYQTDLTKESVAAGYQKVMLEVFKSDRDIDIMSELCLRYRLSNTDAAKIAERAKTGKGGITNLDYLGYSTLRGPDFLNRMTLFTARCIQDGVWDAFYLDDNKSLTYDCAKDKRFAAYFNNSDTNSAEYIKAKSAYLSAVRIYNEEHPELTLRVGVDKLPEPYSQKEIRQFKMFAEAIYGAYDKSQKAKMEHVFLGRQLGFFSTWLNPHSAFWFRRKGMYYEYYKSEDENGNPIIKKDAFSGNELWLNEDGNVVEKTADGIFLDDTGNEITTDTSKFVPINDRDPVEVQGMAYTLMSSLKALTSENGYEEFKKRVLSNEYERQNLDKLKFDLILWALFAALFKCILMPSYKEATKECDDLATLVISDTVVQAANNSYNGFVGLYALMDYTVNDVKPSGPQVVGKLLSESYKTVLGKETYTALATNNVPVLRLFEKGLKQTNPELYKIEKDE